MASSNWKKVELAKCRALGGERSGPTGRDTPDCKDIHVALEVKAYKRFVFLTEDWNQAVENAAKVGLPPVLNVREGGRGGRDMVQMKPATFGWLAGDETFAFHVGEKYIDPVCVRGELLVRLDWDVFAALYQRRFNNGKESLG